MATAQTCNYRCAYCFLPPAVLGEKLTVHAEPETWKQAFERVESRASTPGSRGFANCLRKSTVFHLTFNSNLSNSSIVEFAKRVDPSRISFINAGVHAQERVSRRGLEKFHKHAACLKKHGFPLFISIVATSDVLYRVDEIIALTKPIGLIPIPKRCAICTKGRYILKHIAQRRRSLLLNSRREHVIVTVSHPSSEP